MIYSLAKLRQLLNGFFVALAWQACIFLANQSFAEAEHFVIDKEGPLVTWGKSIGDINGDGRLDLIVGGHNGTAPIVNRILSSIGLAEEKPAYELVWYQNPNWKRHIIATDYPIRTDLEVADMDGDGDNDVVALSDKGVILLRNPSWQATIITPNKYHDIEIADIDRDKRLDIVLRNQAIAGYNDGDKITIYRQKPSEWLRSEFIVEQGEGLKLADLDGDKFADVVISRYWYKNPYNSAQSTSNWSENRYAEDWQWPDVYVDVFDVNQDGELDILLSPSESVGERYRISWFEKPLKTAGFWKEHMIEEDVEAVHHFIAAGDYNGDSLVDVFSAEMNQGVGSNEVKVYLAQRDGSWKKHVLDRSGSHSMRVADLDGDFDDEVFGAKWQINGYWDRHQVDLWDFADKKPLWKKHVIGSNGPRRNLFIATGDLNGDDFADIAAGPNWYKNPGSLSRQWQQHPIGLPAATAIEIIDIDGDLINDIFACTWDQHIKPPGLVQRLQNKIQNKAYPGIAPGNQFSWAKNDGKAQFTFFDNIDHGSGDYLQGFTFQVEGEKVEKIFLSWHKSGLPIEQIVVPPNGASQTWKIQQVSKFSQDEALSLGDINRDGSADLVTGTAWLDGKNNFQMWRISEDQAEPDRNLIRDINDDGRLDVVVGFEAINKLGKLAWYQQGQNPMAPWQEHIIAEVIGPMSLAVEDIDKDGDQDVLVGEHDMLNASQARLIWFENSNGEGTQWRGHLLAKGDEHHDGLKVLDLDKDGDLDIISIGWNHSDIMVFENPGLAK